MARFILCAAGQCNALPVFCIISTVYDTINRPQGFIVDSLILLCFAVRIKGGESLQCSCCIIRLFSDIVRAVSCIVIGRHSDSLPNCFKDRLSVFGNVRVASHTPL